MGCPQVRLKDVRAKVALVEVTRGSKTKGPMFVLCGRV